MDVEKLETIDGIDTATKLTMTTKKGKKTLHKTAIIINDIKYNQDIDKSIFNTRNIEKGL
jgi:hypothetical protein